MAHSTVHFSVGMITGIACGAPLLLRAWRECQRVAQRATQWLLLAWALGIFAEFPGILRRLRVPDQICDGPWMNIFLLYPLINEAKPGGQTMGPILMAMLFGCQYALLLLLIIRSCKSRE